MSERKTITIVLGLDGCIVSGASVSGLPEDTDLNIQVLDYDVSDIDESELSINGEGSKCYNYDVCYLKQTEEEITTLLGTSIIENSKKG